LPSDVLGVAVFNPDTRDFEFKPGPIFANIVLADEINRTTPKTQSALLEAMNESQVTIDNVTRPLPRPFMVLATQNPVEHHGTYPLPESQLDRFLMKIRIGYPDPGAEKEILGRFTNGNRLQTVEPVLGPGEVVELQDESRRVHISEDLIDYIVRIVNETRHHPEIQLGVSPRGTTALFRATQSMALVSGRDYVVPDDIRALVAPVLAHRLVVAESAHGLGYGDVVLEDILARIPVPV
jgi:MoxR-like ATPase